MASGSHSFTKRMDLFSRVLETTCHVSPHWHPNSSEQPPPQNEYVALWDTGATGSAISEKVVRECNLKSIGPAQARTANDLIVTSRHLVNIHLPNNVVFVELPVTLLKLGDVDVLIGMDIISMGDFAVTNLDGAMTLSFRMPSQVTIDFVAEQESGQ